VLAIAIVAQTYAAVTSFLGQRIFDGLPAESLKCEETLKWWIPIVVASEFVAPIVNLASDIDAFFMGI
jgi:hypothetical protein